MKINHLAKPIKNDLQPRGIVKRGFGLNGAIGNMLQPPTIEGNNAPASASQSGIDAKNPHHRPHLGKLGNDVIRNVKIRRHILHIVIIIKRIKKL